MSEASYCFSNLPKKRRRIDGLPDSVSFLQHQVDEVQLAVLCKITQSLDWLR